MSVFEALVIVLTYIGCFLINHFEAILSFLGLCISYIILKSTIKSINEQNRPFVSFSIEPVKNPGNLFVFIRNTGNRTAYDIEIKTEPKLISECSIVKKTPLIISKNGEIQLSGLAPSQTIQSFFDKGLYRYKSDNDKLKDKLEVEIKYSYKKKNFEEKTNIDFSYLRNQSSINTPEDIDTNIKRIADNLTSIDSKLNKVVKNEK